MALDSSHGVFAGTDWTLNRIERRRRERERGAGYVDLTCSDPTRAGLRFPPGVLRAAAGRYWRRRRYAPDPRGDRRAREAVARWYAAQEPPLAVDPADVFLTASTSEAYGLLFALLGDAGDNVLGPEVTYPLFPLLAEAHRLELRPYPLRPERGWVAEGAGVAAAADGRSRAVLVVSPHNPTGAVLRERDESLAAQGLPLIADQVFAPYPYGVARVPPVGALYPDLPVFHLGGISKAFALPDLKLSWIVLSGPHPAGTCERLELLNDLYLGANGLSQALLPTLFRRGGPFQARVRRRVRANLATALRALGRLPGVSLDPPDGGWTLMPAVAGAGDEEALVLRGLDAGVLVHPGYFYGLEEGPARLVLSALPEPAEFAEGLRRLAAVLGE